MGTIKEVVKVGQLELRFLLDGNDTNNKLVMFELIIPPGAKVPISHYHVNVNETLYSLEGMFSSIVDGKAIEIGPGDKCYIGRGLVHYHDNLTDKAAKALCVLTPSSIGPTYFKELAAIIKPGIPPDPQMAKEIMLRHGLVAAVKQ